MPVSAGPPGAASEPSGHREPEPGSWTALVRADRAWFDQVQAKEGPDAASVGFPPYCPDRLFALSGRQLSVGRGSRSRGIAPEIDLSGPPLDPGVSALHAMFVPHGEGWAVVDLDSTNGTTVNGSAETIPPNTPVPVADGDRIHLGAWTTITVARTPQG